MENKRKIYFRADASAQIGYGHFIRTLALADMLKDDFDCTFFTQSPTDYQQREVEKVCPLIALPSDESKFEKFLEYLSGDEIVVLDNYFFTSEYQSLISEVGCKLVCIDDIPSKHFYADAIINHGFVNSKMYDVEDYSQVFLGPQYALLRKDFLNIHKAIHKCIDCLVCFGGVDEYNLTEKVVRQNPKLKICAIVGEHYKYIESLSSNKNVEVLCNLNAAQMAEKLSEAKTVICSSSTICYEALSCGCLVYSGYYVDNQIMLYSGLKDNRYIVPLGNLLKANLSLSHYNSHEIKTLCFHDVKENLKHIFMTDISIREAKYKDASLLYKWANDSEVRANAYSTERIKWNVHQKWLSQRFKSGNSYIYICYKCRKAFGQVRFDLIKADTVIIDYSIDKCYRGQGLASRMLASVIRYHNNMNPEIKKYYAEVKHTNIASAKVFMRIGFQKRNLNSVADSYLYIIQ